MRNIADMKVVSYGCAATPKGYNKAMSHGVSGVPTILINDKVAFVGMPPSADALKQVVRSFSMA